MIILPIVVEVIQSGTNVEHLPTPGHAESMEIQKTCSCAQKSGNLPAVIEASWSGPTNIHKTLALGTFLEQDNN